MVTIPHDYEERVYAGVLGKIIGVYLGRPFEGWSNARIERELGEVRYYVHERLGKPLIVTDDDITGTFTFLRAMPDYGCSRELTPRQIGQTWLNYLVEGRTILWWGGMGNSTEHTAYLRLKAGVPAPESGSMAWNGRVVAEQIGAQIFIDGWGMIAPGDPELAADLARRAASVSHDGEAIHGAQVIAAMEAQAFVEPDLERLLDIGTGVIPADCLIRRLIDDLRGWRGRCDTWREALALVAANYGYDKYGGNCHMVPNHALIIMALLYGEDSFQRSLTIVNTAGWDTDCNAGNVGCLMGIKNGLAGIEDGADLRGPVADRLYLPTADGGRAVSDALSEAYAVAAIGRALAGEAQTAPKDGARYHFSLAGAVQGWLADEAPECRGVLRLENVALPGAQNRRALALRYRALADGRVARARRETFPDCRHDPTHGYAMVACPALHSGQTVRARLMADAANNRPVEGYLFVQTWGAGDALTTHCGPEFVLGPGDVAEPCWRLQVPTGEPVAYVGVALTSVARVDGTVYLDWLTWDGAPEVRLGPPRHDGTRWRQSYVDAISSWGPDGADALRLIQNEGRGLLIQGTRAWPDYAVSARLRPHLAQAFGLAARVQGLRRYYALLLTRDAQGRGVARLVRELDGERVLAETACDWELYAEYALTLEACGGKLVGRVGDMLELTADDTALDGGAAALLLAEGRLGCEGWEVRPAR